MRVLNVVMAMVACAAVFAQQTGTISGQVIEASTGEPLRGATVLVDGTKRGAITDPKGNFAVKNIAPGQYSVSVRYVGYETKCIPNVVVKPGQVTTLRIVLDRDRQLVTQDVVVEARRTTETAAALLAQRKNSAQVTDGVSIEDIKKLPDTDAGQALRRVPGVTLAADKFLIIRGTSDRYSTAALNGIALGSSEPDRKAFAFDLFPAELLESATIAKTYTPDLPGNATGGMVELTTVEFPSTQAVRVSVSSSVNDNAFLQPNRFIRSVSGRWDWLGFDDGTRSSLPADMPADRRQMSELLRAVRNPYDETGARERWTQLSRQFNNANWQRRQQTLQMPNSSLAFSLALPTTLFGNELGIIATLTHQTSWNIATIERNGILADRSLMFRTSGYNPSRSANLGGMLNLAYRLSDYSTISVRNVFSHTADEDVVVLNGQHYVQMLDLKQISMQYVEKTLLSSAIAGEHTLVALGNAALDWRIGYTSSRRMEPDLRRFRFSRLIPQDGAPADPYVSDIPSLTPLGQGDGVRAGRFFSDLNERSWSGAANITVPIGELKLKSGALLEWRSRRFSARSFTYVPGPDFALDYSVFTLPDSVEWADPSPIFKPENFGPQGIGISEDSRLADAYDAGEQLRAGYVMADWQVATALLPLRVIAGLRYEDNLQTLSSYDLSDRPVDVRLRTQDVLPALSIIAKLSERSNLRLALSRTLARPSLREFAPFTFYDYATQSQVMGNPNLTRALVTNIDARWEYFPTPGEVMSASVFYKRFLHAIEETIYMEQSEIARTFSNADGPAVNYGIELELRKRLDMLGSWGENVMVALNYARIFSEVTIAQGGQLDRRPMWGQSPYTLNAVLMLAVPELDATLNLAYNVIGRRIVLVGLRNAYQFSDPHTYELPRDMVDLTATKRFGDWELRVVVRNLLNARLLWEQGGTIVQSTLTGRSIGIGVSYRLTQ